MFPPSLPHYFIHKFTSEGDVVLDPFAGRGTTPLQACVDGRIGIGNDLNPMAYILNEAKVAPPPAPMVRKRIEELRLRYDSPTIEHVPEQIQMLYHKNTLSQLVYLKQEFGLNDAEFPDTILNLYPVDTFITGLILGILHGQSGQYLSVSMPNTFSMSEGYVKDYIQKEGLEPPNRDVFQKLLDRLRTIYENGPPARRGHAFFGDARNLPSALAKTEEAPNRADLVFTSPPYLKVLKYGLYNWIRLWFLNQEPDTVDQRLDDELDLEEYLEFMTDTFEVMDDVIDPNSGVAAFVIGDVNQNGEVINLAREVAEEVVAPMENFEIGRIVEDRVPDNEKVSRIWGDTKGEATEIDRILIAHRGEITVRENPSGLQTKSLPGKQETLGSFNN